MVYEWGRKSFGVDAQAIGEIVERIAAQHSGVCPPGEFVHAVRDPTSPGHKLLTWDEKAAAHKWRVREARNVISSLSVVIEESPDEQHRTPAFVHVRIEQSDGDVAEGYTSVRNLTDADLRRQAVAETVGMMKGLRARLDAFEEFHRVALVIDETLASVALPS